jgi:hypothetical protein
MVGSPVLARSGGGCVAGMPTGLSMAVSWVLIRIHFLINELGRRFGLWPPLQYRFCYYCGCPTLVQTNFLLLNDVTGNFRKECCSIYGLTAARVLYHVVVVIRLSFA